MATVITRIFIISTIVARAPVGRKGLLRAPTPGDIARTMIVVPTMDDKTECWSRGST